MKKASRSYRAYCNNQCKQYVLLSLTSYLLLGVEVVVEVVALWRWSCCGGGSGGRVVVAEVRGRAANSPRYLQVGLASDVAEGGCCIARASWTKSMQSPTMSVIALPGGGTDGTQHVGSCVESGWVR